LRKKVHPSDLARGCSDLEMTWFLCCAVAATVGQIRLEYSCIAISKHKALQWTPQCHRGRQLPRNTWKRNPEKEIYTRFRVLWHRFKAGRNVAYVRQTLVN